MPMIIPSTDLRNDYAKISELAHTTDQPIFITKNGRGDLAVMSVESWEKIQAEFELWGLLAEGRVAVTAGDTVAMEEGFDEVLAEFDHAK